MKTCLICCHYPPLSRTHRRLQFARLLAAGGLDVEVVAHANPSRALGSFVDDPGTLATGPPVRRVRALPWHLVGEALAAAGFLPCPYLNWVRPAVRAAQGIASGPQDVVFGIYPPLTNLIAAYATARRTGARLVVDFRDEYLSLTRGLLQRRWARRWEARLRRRADLVSVATAAVGEGFLARGLPPERLHVTPNGYWSLPEPDPPYAAGRRCRVVYVGALSAAQGPEILCVALAHLRRLDAATADRVEVVFHGPDNLYARRALQPRLVPGCRYEGYLPAAAVSRVLAGADVGFLSLASPAFAYAVPGKLFDYIAHGLPLLASLPDGAARQLIEAEGIGCTAPCGDAAALARQLAAVTSPEARRRLHGRVLELRPRHAAAPHFLSLSRRIQAL